jgi:hypothetical protein
VEAWVEAQRTILNSSDSASINLATKISTENSQIPIIETNEKDSITGNYLNLDTIEIKKDPSYLKRKLAEFKRYNNHPIVMVLKETPYTANHYYYGESELLKEVQLYPIVQLVIVASSLRSRYLRYRPLTKVHRTSYGHQWQKKPRTNWAHLFRVYRVGSKY